MRIKLFAAGVAIALAAGLASASAAEQFTTLDGVTAVAMSSVEQDAVRGSVAHFTVSTSGAGGVIDPDANDAAGPVAGSLFRVGHAGEAVAPGFNGLCVASNGVIGPIGC